MAFWGVEVKPSAPYTLRLDGEQGRLHLSQATLGSGSSTKKSILQCRLGDKKPIYLCSLLPDKIETCPLNLEFEEEDEVIFSVLGPQSIHLSGFFLGESEDAIGDDYGSDSYGEDISGRESDEPSIYDSEDDYLADDLNMYPPSPVPNSGVVIEEIVDDEKHANDNGVSEHQKKKNQSGASEDEISERQLVVRSNSEGQDLQSEDEEDEDGFPISSRGKKKSDASSIKDNKEVKDKRDDEKATKKKAKDDSLRSLKRKVDAMVEDTEQKSKSGQRSPETRMKQNQKKKAKNKEREACDVDSGGKNNQKSESGLEAVQQITEESDEKISTEKNLGVDADSGAEEKKKKKKKKKNKKQEDGADAVIDQPVANKTESLKEMGQRSKKKPNQMRTYPNGLVVEEVAMGRPDGKKASPGKKVSVFYIGKLKKNGEIFDSNIGRAPFKFRLGIGQVIKGWDVGVNGMRIGDKRRLTIPPAMGYGDKGAGKTIPPNAWLVFDVELVDVN